MGRGRTGVTRVPLPDLLGGWVSEDRLPFNGPPRGGPSKERRSSSVPRGRREGGRGGPTVGEEDEGTSEYVESN